MEQLEQYINKPRYTKDCQQPLRSGREARNIFSLQSSEGTNHANTYFQISDRQNCEGTSSCCLSHLVCGLILQQLQDTNKDPRSGCCVCKQHSLLPWTGTANNNWKALCQRASAPYTAVKLLGRFQDAKEQDMTCT